MSQASHGSIHTSKSSKSCRGDAVLSDASSDTADLSQRIFNHGADGFFQWRPLRNSFVFSPSFANLLGYVPGRLPLNVAAIAAHIYSEDYAKVKLFLASSLLSGQDNAIEFRMITQAADVSWYQMQLRVESRTEDGKIDCALACIANIDHIVTNLSQYKTQADNEQWLRLTIRQLLQRQDDEAMDDCLNQFCNRVNIDHIVLREAYRDGERFRLIARGRHRRCSDALDFSKIVLRKHLPYEFSLAEKGKSVMINDIDAVPSLSPTFKQRIDELNIRALATLPILYHGNIDYYLSLIMTSDPHVWSETTIRLAEALGDALAQVAARQRIAQTLELSEERFQNALEACQDGIWDWDIIDEKFFVTPSFLYMLGYDEEYLPLNRGKISKIILPPNNLNDFFAGDDSNKGHIDQIMQLRHRQGHMVWVWVRANQIEWDKDGKATRVVGVNVDISRFRTGMGKKTDDPANTSVSTYTNAIVNNPLPLKTEAASQNLPLSPASVDETLRRSKILLAEDNPINQQVATGILKRKGVTVTIVNNGQEAVDMLNASPPNSFDLVLMDMEMPVLDGYAATRVLRDLSQFKDLPIIALTAHARDEDKQTCLRLGMNDHVAKPVKPDTLYAAIARQLEHRQSITRH